MKKIIFLLGIIFFLFYANANTVLASGGLGIAPYQEENQEKRSWFIYKDVEPKEIIKDTLFIINKSEEVASVVVYPVDAYTNEDGGYSPAQDDFTNIGVGTWITLEQGEFILKPGEIKLVNFTINIPEKVEIGDHAGTILIKNTIPANVYETEKETGKTVDTGLRVVSRTGVRVYITTTGDLIRKLFFDALSFEKTKDKAIFSFHLANEGNTRLTPGGAIEIYDMENNLLETFSGNLREIFPFSKTVAPLEWQAPKSGKFVAKGIISNPDTDKGGRLINSVAFEWETEEEATEREEESFYLQILTLSGLIILVLFIIIIKLIRRKK